MTIRLKSTPLFSILIANYNNGIYIEKAISSVYSQTYQNWEVIIVDDASVDNSIEILSKISDNRVRIFFNSKNKGCGFTKNKCVALAIGDICGFLDPDDALHPNALAEMVAAHSKNEEHSLIYSSHFECDENLNILSIASYVGGIQPDESHLTQTGKGISHFATFKRAKYLKTKGISKSFKKAVDQDLYYKLEETGPVLFIDKPLYYYRLNKNGISLFENSSKAFSWNLRAMRDAFKRREKDENKKTKNITQTELMLRHHRFYFKKATLARKEKRWVSVLINLVISIYYFPKSIFSLLLPRTRHLFSSK